VDTHENTLILLSNNLRAYKQYSAKLKGIVIFYLKKIINYASVIPVKAGIQNNVSG